jgi:hypothetical protein
MLLEWGADIKVANNAGRRPLFVAWAKSHWDIFDLLYDLGDEVSKEQVCVQISLP